MLASILSALSSAFVFLAELFGWMKQQDVKEGAQAEVKAEALSKQVEATLEANKIREDVAIDLIESTPAERMSDDGFARD